ncbi:MAG TPA: alpha-amylase family glycosyl hydrolase [Paludibacter sp.]|nr:alpha-amylase family glycosyl hydrolase [Paludibacter sp.]
MSKFTIYQVFPRLFGNRQTFNKPNGSKEENGCGKFNDFTTRALAEIKALGITHVWYTGIIEHATQTDYSEAGIGKDHPAVVKGKAGSPYAIKDYYDVDPDLAENLENRMLEFEDLVKRTHDAGLKVLIDFVPNHVARQYHSDAKPAGVKDLGEGDNPAWAFSPLNNFYYIPNQHFTPQFDTAGYSEFPAKATGNDQFTASPTRNDWYETVKLNYGVNYVEGCQKQFDPIPGTWNKMLDILLFWAGKKIDGFRCDMAEMVPVEFWNYAVSHVKQEFPDIVFIAEVYQPAEYRNYIYNGKFDYLYDKVGLYDMLRNITTRNFPASNISNAWQALGGIENKMLNFMENHDEQRIGSVFFSGNGLCAVPAMIVSATLTQAPVMVYSGQELGEKGMDHEGFSGLDGRTTIFDYWGMGLTQDWINGGKFDGGKLTCEQRELRLFYQRLLNIALTEKAITQGLMYDLEFANFDNPAFDPHHQFAYFRKHDDDLLLVVLNFCGKLLDTGVRFPPGAFQYLGVEESGRYGCSNLLDPEETFPEAVNINSHELFEIQMPAWSGKIIKLKTL